MPKLFSPWKSTFRSSSDSNNNNNNNTNSNSSSSSKNTTPLLSKSKSGRSRLNALNPIHLLSRRRSSAHRSSWPGQISAPKFSDDYDPCIRGNQLHEFGASAKPTVKSAPPATLPFPPKKNPAQPGLQPQRPAGPGEARQAPPEGGVASNETPREPPSTEPSVPSVSPGGREGTDADKHDDENKEKPPVESNEDDDNNNNNDNNDAPEFPYLTVPGLSHRASRFSFDLSENEGERILEEKAKQLEAEHRQNLIGKKFKHDSGSSFDDMGEFDAFDYDAMLDDYEGNNAFAIEEPVPGVNTDAIEENDECQQQQQQGVRDVSVDVCSVATGSTVNQHNEDSLAVPHPPTAGAVTETSASAVDDERRKSIADLLSTEKPTEYPQYTSDDVSSQIPNDPKRDSEAEAATMPDPEQDEALDPVAQNNGVAQETNNNDSPRQESASPIQEPTSRLSLDPFEDDEIYFDDGVFGGGQGTATTTTEETRQLPAFDESMFDDETSYLYDKSHISSLKHDNTRRPVSLGEQKQDKDVAGHEGLEGQSSSAITELNLYHDALAKAATEASLNGRFDQNPESESMTSHSNNNTTDDENDSPRIKTPLRISLGPCAKVAAGLFDVDVGFPLDPAAAAAAASSFDDYNNDHNDCSPDYDDDDNDDIDAIIAEANADALENDVDGFYGREFGFYARAPLSSAAADTGGSGGGGGAAAAASSSSSSSSSSSPKEMVYGGYFGESAALASANGIIHHSNSGRGGNCHEPSLTPITERSEWSTRNSMISVVQQQAQQQAGASPGPTSAAAVGGEASQMQGHDGSSLLDEPDMALEALLKLRRSAFRDSSSSLVHTPPQSPRPPPTNNNNNGNGNGSVPPSPSSLTSCSQLASSPTHI